ncbi:unnamed protein product [Ciceribacter sp. T2.26MG-112.2]|nr:unnamed protein product [Ciceribacter naphthalenivorans]
MIQSSEVNAPGYFELGRFNDRADGRSLNRRCAPLPVYDFKREALSIV